MDLAKFLIPDESIQVWIGLNIILAWSFYIVLSTGQLNIGVGAFMALGAYGASVASVKFGVPLFVAILLSALVGAVTGTLVGFPALRVRGIYLAMMTIGVAEIVQALFRNLDYVGGPMGFRGMKGGSAWMIFLSVVVLGIFIWKLESSRLGRAFRATHDDEVVATTMGLNTTYIKVLAFAIGAAMASLAGGLYAHYARFIAPENFDIWQSFYPTFFVILGGTQTFWGAAFGAIVLTLLPEYFRPLHEWRVVIYGLVIVAMLAYRPQGLISETMIHNIFDFFRSIGSRLGRRRSAAAKRRPKGRAPAG